MDSYVKYGKLHGLVQVRLRLVECDILDILWWRTGIVMRCSSCVNALICIIVLMF